jgi:predicted O-methyltransferase YrrM|tara:strand:+ start:507 stop:1166 length:660 start_codon:yes stop_codon:yes gene_type:complete
MDKAVPKYWKGKYDVYDFESYKDVPGWVNDAEFIYEEMVNQAEDGDHFVEIGVLLGQSTARMGELIRDSKKKIRFDAIDIFWIIEHTIRNYKLSGHPKEFFHYIDELKTEWDLDIMNMIRHPLKALGVVDYVNFITCEEQYAHSIYKDNSLKFVWIDGDHGADVVYNDLVNFWPKIKVGGTIGGDDIHYEEVLNDVKKFSKKYKVNVKYDYNSFLITKE